MILIYCLGNSIKKLNNLVNADLIRLVNWLNANKILLNVKKTEMVIFKSKQKKFEGDLKIKLCGKRLYPTESFKYLGVKTDTNFTWQHHGSSAIQVLPSDIRKYLNLFLITAVAVVFICVFISVMEKCIFLWM